MKMPNTKKLSTLRKPLRIEQNPSKKFPELKFPPKQILEKMPQKKSSSNRHCDRFYSPLSSPSKFDGRPRFILKGQLSLVLEFVMDFQKTLVCA